MLESIFFSHYSSIQKKNMLNLQSLKRTIDETYCINDNHTFDMYDYL